LTSPLAYPYAFAAPILARHRPSGTYQVVLKLSSVTKSCRNQAGEGFANLTTDSDYNHLAKHVNANRFA